MGCCKSKDKKLPEEKSCYFYDGEENNYMWDDDTRQGFTCTNTQKHFTQDTKKPFVYWDDLNPEVVLDISAVLAQESGQQQPEQPTAGAAADDQQQWQQEEEPYKEEYYDETKDYGYQYYNETGAAEGQYESQQAGAYGTVSQGAGVGAGGSIAAQQQYEPYDENYKPDGASYSKTASQQQWQGEEYDEQTGEKNYEPSYRPAPKRGRSGRGRSGRSPRGTGRSGRSRRRLGAGRRGDAGSRSRRSRPSIRGPPRRGPPRGTVVKSRVPGRKRRNDRRVPNVEAAVEGRVCRRQAE